MFRLYVVITCSSNRVQQIKQPIVFFLYRNNTHVNPVHRMIIQNSIFFCFNYFVYTKAKKKKKNRAKTRTNKNLILLYVVLKHFHSISHLPAVLLSKSEYPKTIQSKYLYTHTRAHIVFQCNSFRVLFQFLLKTFCIYGFQKQLIVVFFCSLLVPAFTFVVKRRKKRECCEIPV